MGGGKYRGACGLPTNRTYRTDGTYRSVPIGRISPIGPIRSQRCGRSLPLTVPHAPLPSRTRTTTSTTTSTRTTRYCDVCAADGLAFGCGNGELTGEGLEVSLALDSSSLLASFWLLGSSLSAFCQYTWASPAFPRARKVSPTCSKTTGSSGFSVSAARSSSVRALLKSP